MTVLKEVRFRFRHDGCWLQETTKRYPGIMLVVSSAYVAGKDVVVTATVHASDRETIDRAEADWRAHPSIRSVSRVQDGPRGTRFHVRYSTPSSIFHHILEHAPVSIGTIRVADNTEHYQLLGHPEDIQDLLVVLAQKGTLEVQSVRETDTIDEPEASPELGAPWWTTLTDKQLEALVLAFLGGYYQWPRDRSAGALAEDAGLSGSAFLDHLRHAESKVMAAMIEDMRLREPGLFEAIQARRRPPVGVRKP